jgi:hypothetical protein
MVTSPDRNESPVGDVAPETGERAKRLFLLGCGLAAFGVLVHFLPVPTNLKSLVGAVTLVWVSGLPPVSWLPRQRIDLTIPIVIAGGLSAGVLIASLLLIVDWYSPDRAAVLTGILALALLFVRTRKAGHR